MPTHGPTTGSDARGRRTFTLMWKDNSNDNRQGSSDFGIFQNLSPTKANLLGFRSFLGGPSVYGHTYFPQNLGEA